MCFFSDLPLLFKIYYDCVIVLLIGYVWLWCVCACMLSCLSPVFVTLWTVTYQAPLPPPWDSSGKNTGVSCQAVLQGIFPTQGLNPGLLHLPAFAGVLFTTSTTWETLIMTYVLLFRLFWFYTKKMHRGMERGDKSIWKQ